MYKSGNDLTRRLIVSERIEINTQKLNIRIYGIYFVVLQTVT